MLTVTQEFKDALTAPVKSVSGYIVLQDGTEILPGGDLQKYTIKSIGGFLRTAMSQITLSLLGNHDLRGTTIDVYYGVEIDGSMNYVLKGKFNLTDVVYKKDTGTTEVVGYDNMMQFQVDYTNTGDYPTTLYDYLLSICALAGVVLENETIYNGTLSIPEDYYQNVEEFTIRDVLEDICEASASYAVINSEGKLELRQIEDSGEIVTYAEMLKLQVEDYWGGINSLVLSRQPQNDDVFAQDANDINAPTTHNILDIKKLRVSYSTEES